MKYNIIKTGGNKDGFKSLPTKIVLEILNEDSRIFKRTVDYFTLYNKTIKFRGINGEEFKFEIYKEDKVYINNKHITRF